MSVFILNKENLNNCKNQIYFLRDRLCYNMDDCDNFQTIINKCYEYNQQSYDERYKENNKIEPLTETKTIPINIFQFLKSLQALRYNIEGNTEKNKEVKTLEQLIDRTKSAIIEIIPEYEKATWG